MSWEPDPTTLSSHRLEQHLTYIKASEFSHPRALRLTSRKNPSCAVRKTPLRPLTAIRVRLLGPPCHGVAAGWLWHQPHRAVHNLSKYPRSIFLILSPLTTSKFDSVKWNISPLNFNKLNTNHQPPPWASVFELVLDNLWRWYLVYLALLNQTPLTSLLASH